MCVITNKYFSNFKKNRIENFIGGQDFYQIQKKHSKTNRFIDLNFKTIDESVFSTQNFRKTLFKEGYLQTDESVIWKRAKVMKHGFIGLL